MELTDKKIAASVLGLAIAISTLIQSVIPVRSDAFTGTQAEQLQATLIEKISYLKVDGESRKRELYELHKMLHDLQLKVAALPPDRWQERINSIERKAIKQEQILQSLVEEKRNR